MTYLTHIRRMLLVVFGSFALSCIPALAQNVPTFEAVSAQVATGKNVRVELRLVGITPPPATSDISITASRIDMGPDGMATMAAPLKALPSPVPGVLAFETELSMAGRWALSITANIKGRAGPIKSVVVFTAVEKKSEAPPAPQGQRKIVYYRNPMGLADVSPTPKKDSMGMDYIPVYDDEAGGPNGALRLSPEKVQRAGVRITKAAKQSVSRLVRAPAIIVADEARIGVVTAKFSGFVEELFVPASGGQVHEGQKLMRVWIETTDILNKQADLTSTLGGAQQSTMTQEGAERNLRFFGFGKETIEDIRRAGKPLRSVNLYVPRAGTVVDKPAVVGMRFESGATLFKTADLSTVWVVAQVAERDLGLIHVGQKARVVLNAYPSEVREGQVALIYPELIASTRTVPVRIELANPDGRLKPGLYADVRFEGQAANGPVVAIPESAVIDSGSRRVAFVAKGEGLFEPRDLILGARGGGQIEVKEGIAEGEDVVVTGNFLLDAESNLKAALAVFTPAEPSK